MEISTYFIILMLDILAVEGIYLGILAVGGIYLGIGVFHYVRVQKGYNTERKQLGAQYINKGLIYIRAISVCALITIFYFYCLYMLYCRL